MAEVSADDVLADVSSVIPSDGIAQAAIVLIQYCVPGREDINDRGPFLAFRRDTTHGAWNHLGMLECLVNDIRADLRCENRDE